MNRRMLLKFAAASAVGVILPAPVVAEERRFWSLDRTMTGGAPGRAGYRTDSDYLQAFIDWHRTHGNDVVVFPKGIWELTQPLDISGVSEVYGCAAGADSATVLSITPAAEYAFVVNPAEVRKLWLISNFYVEYPALKSAVIPVHGFAV